MAKYLDPLDVSLAALVATYPKISKKESDRIIKTVKSPFVKKIIRCLIGGKTKDAKVKKAVKELLAWAEACRTVHAPPKRCKCK